MVYPVVYYLNYKGTDLAKYLIYQFLVKAQKFINQILKVLIIY